MVRQRDSGQVFAMKMLHKWEMLKRAEVSVGSDGTCAPYEWAGGGGCAASGACRACWGRGRPGPRDGRGSNHQPPLLLPHNKPFLEATVVPIFLTVTLRPGAITHRPLAHPGNFYPSS